MSRSPSVQTQHLRLDSIEGGVVTLEGGSHLAVLEVEPTTFALQGEREREAIISGFSSFLNSLAFPIQILVRVIPLDQARYLDDLERRAREELPEELRELARDHALFLRRLARSRTLLERRFHIVVSAESEAGLGRGLWPLGLRKLFGSSPKAPHKDPYGGLTRDRDAVPIQARDGARRQLTFRCEEIERGLGRCGLGVRRLQDGELAQLLYACWCPELSRIQRLERDLREYTTLVVRASRRASRPLEAAEGTSPPTEHLSVGTAKRESSMRAAAEEACR